MVDFSRAESSKNYKSSFDKTVNAIIDYVQQTQNLGNTTWLDIETNRKERAAFVESTIQLLKKNHIKLPKQLGRCKNKEINEELLKVINELPFEDKEEIQCNLIKINNRYDKIIELGKKMEELGAILSEFRVPESDYEDEVVIDFSKSKKKNETKKTKELSSSDESLEQVIEIKKASEELCRDLDKTLEHMKRTAPSRDEQRDVMSSIINDDDITYTNESVLYDTDIISVVSDEITDITSMGENQTDEESIDKYLDNEVPKEEDSDEYLLFTINDKLTLKEIAKNVYGEEKFWKDLYNYGTNKGKIDRKAAEHKVSVEAVASFVGYLQNITLQFPRQLVTIEEVPVSEYEQRKNGRRMAA